jgi:maleate isomerase
MEKAELVRYDMIGWKARFGVMIPRGNFTMEPELYKMIPEGISIHFARLFPKAEDTVAPSLERLLGYGKEVPNAAKSLSFVKPDVIAFGCTSGSLIEGIRYDKEIIKKIESTTGIRGTTTSTAVIAALKEMGIRNVCVATPYPDWLNEKTKEFLEGNGFNVLVIKGLKNVGRHSNERPERTYRLAREAYETNADGVFISCTALRTIEILEELEEDIGKPVVSSTQATLWMMMRMVGIKKQIPHFGKLLRSL